MCINAMEMEIALVQNTTMHELRTILNKYNVSIDKYAVVFCILK